MAMNALQNLETTLLQRSGEIFIESSVREQAVHSIQRMLDFAALRK
jgi:quinolinate synthase